MKWPEYRDGYISGVQIRGSSLYVILPLTRCRTIVALVYNVLKTMMQINTKLFDELINSYKADKQR